MLAPLNSSCSARLLARASARARARVVRNNEFLDFALPGLRYTAKVMSTVLAAAAAVAATATTTLEQIDGCRWNKTLRQQQIIPPDGEK